MTRRNKLIISFIVGIIAIMIIGFNLFINEKTHFSKDEQGRSLTIKSSWFKSHLGMHNMVTLSGIDENGIPFATAMGFGENYSEMIDSVARVSWEGPNNLIVESILKDGEKHTFRCEFP
ncbi:MAG: hypothetical protein AAFN10_03925 [Bacteroidota bacterium]